MGMIRSTLDYIKQEEFKITIKINQIDIENYDKLGIIDDNQMIIYKGNLKIKIKGKSLTIKKLINNEILIMGNYSEISFEDNNE